LGLGFLLESVLKGILMQIRKAILCLLLLLLLVSRRRMYIDIGVIIINNYDSAISSIQMDVLDLVSCLRPLMVGLAVLLRLYHHLVRKVASVIYAASHGRCFNFIFI
jgi:hypothetical protein